MWTAPSARTLCLYLGLLSNLLAYDVYVCSEWFASFLFTPKANETKQKNWSLIWTKCTWVTEFFCSLSRQILCYSKHSVHVVHMQICIGIWFFFHFLLLFIFTVFLLLIQMVGSKLCWFKWFFLYRLFSLYISFHYNFSRTKYTFCCCCWSIFFFGTWCQMHLKFGFNKMIMTFALFYSV